jgi:hypothetical protein
VRELLSEFFLFCKSVLLRWSNLFTGGLLAFLFFCYGVLAQNPIPTKLVIGLLAAGFVAAAFSAWREQYLKCMPRLHGEILSLIWTELGAEQTLLLLQLQIVNTGEPSIARAYEAKARLADGTELNAIPSHVRIGVELRSETETTTVDRLIYEETTSAIPSGGQAGGWIGFELPAVRERIHRQDTTIVVSFRDARDNRYSVTCSATGTGKGLKYHPGAGAAPEMNQPPRSDKKDSPA